MISNRFYRVDIVDMYSGKVLDSINMLAINKKEVQEKMYKHKNKYADNGIRVKHVIHTIKR